MTSVSPVLTFKKSERLLKNQEFVRVQKIGRRFHSKHFIIIVACIEEEVAKKTQKKISSNSKRARLGITITKKLEPTSVKRNRVKRLIREAFRSFKERCAESLAVLVIAKSGSTELDVFEVRRQLFGTLKFNGFIR